MDHTANIEARLAENKTSIKTYKSHQMARGRAGNIVKQLAAHGEREMEFMLVYLPSVERFTVIFNRTKWLRDNNVDSYRCILFVFGFLADEGFYSI